jgi:hypothetical protein
VLEDLETHGDDFEQVPRQNKFAQDNLPAMNYDAVGRTAWAALA